MSELNEFREYVEEQQHISHGLDSLARDYDFLLETIDTYQEINQPQLNENQQNLIIWMQDNECETDDPLESISDLFLETEASSSDGWETCLSAAYKSLTNRKKAEMVQKYLEQYLEQEEE